MLVCAGPIKSLQHEPMLHAVAIALVATAGAFLLGLGVVALVLPKLVGSFPLRFAGSPTKHYAELLIRLAIGIAFVQASPTLPAATVFLFFGWVLVATTGVMFFIPWRVHRAFTQASVPKALRFLPVLGIASLVSGTGTLWALSYAGAA
jgi:hypothetical protein